MYEALEASDEEETDESEPVVLMTLREARGLGQAVKIFVQENQTCERMSLYPSDIKSLFREMEATTVSARISKLICMIAFCLRVLRLMLHQLQVPRRIKVLPSSCVCTQLNIAD